MRYRHALMLSSLLFFSNYNIGQKTIKGTEYSHFQLLTKKDTIDFVVADTNLIVRKPILLFCQGSQPVPLFFDFGEQGIFPVPLSNFDLSEMRKNYHVVVISMPKTPLIVGPEHLNKSYNYVLDPANENSYSQEYLKADFVENYVQRAKLTIQFLLKQKWVDPKKLVVAGHSQGARIAVSIAATNKQVTQLGLFGYNPMGRIDQAIRQARKDAEKGAITWEQADSLQQHQYEFYKSFRSEEAVLSDPGLTSWKSFSVSTLDKLTALTIPVYIAYGSEDIVADFCDLVPLYFIEQGKSNLTKIRYPNLEHNFFPVAANGEADYSNGKWPAVMNEFIAWTINKTLPTTK